MKKKIAQKKKEKLYLKQKKKRDVKETVLFGDKFFVNGKARKERFITNPNLYMKSHETIEIEGEKEEEEEEDESEIQYE